VNWAEEGEKEKKGELWEIENKIIIVMIRKQEIVMNRRNGEGNGTTRERKITEFEKM
jgi:hypothetical protein